MCFFASQTSKLDKLLTKVSWQVKNYTVIDSDFIAKSIISDQ